MPGSSSRWRSAGQRHTVSSQHCCTNWLSGADLLKPKVSSQHLHHYVSALRRCQPNGLQIKRIALRTIQRHHPHWPVHIQTEGKNLRIRGVD